MRKSTSSKPLGIMEKIRNFYKYPYEYISNEANMIRKKNKDCNKKLSFKHFRILGNMGATTFKISPET